MFKILGSYCKSNDVANLTQETSNGLQERFSPKPLSTYTGVLVPLESLSFSNIHGHPDTVLPRQIRTVVKWSHTLNSPGKSPWPRSLKLVFPDKGGSHSESFWFVVLTPTFLGKGKNVLGLYSCVSGPWALATRTCKTLRSSFSSKLTSVWRETRHPLECLHSKSFPKSLGRGQNKTRVCYQSY